MISRISSAQAPGAARLIRGATNDRRRFYRFRRLPASIFTRKRFPRRDRARPMPPARQQEAE